MGHVAKRSRPRPLDFVLGPIPNSLDQSISLLDRHCFRSKRSCYFSILQLSPHSLMRHNSLWRQPCGPRSEAFPTPTSRFHSRSDSKLSRPIDFTSRSILLPIETMLLLNLTASFSTSHFFFRSITIIGRYYIIFYWMVLFRCVDLSFVKKRKENLIREKNKVPVEGRQF